MVVSSPARFAAAVAEHPFAELDLESEALARAASSLAVAGLLVVGEPHGVRETPSVLYAVAAALGTRAVAFEWSHEEMEEPVQSFLRTGSFDFERLWSLPASSEFFCGDGRITAGHFALLQRLRSERRLDQVIVFDRLDREPFEDFEDQVRVREPELAARLLAEWDRRLPLLVLTGAFHARLQAPEGEPMAAYLARELPGLEPAMLDYTGGCCWSRGALHDVSGPMPDAPIRLHAGTATPAVVPAPARPADEVVTPATSPSRARHLGLCKGTLTGNVWYAMLLTALYVRRVLCSPKPAKATAAPPPAPRVATASR